MRHPERFCTQITFSTALPLSYKVSQILVFVCKQDRAIYDSNLFKFNSILVEIFIQMYLKTSDF